MMPLQLALTISLVIVYDLVLQPLEVPEPVVALEGCASAW